MTDKELLELAAKAAGIGGGWKLARGAGHVSRYVDEKGAAWCPLHNDGDRYRLARACNLRIDFYQGMVYGANLQTLGCWSPGNMKDEARAIVRAAAACAPSS